MARSIPSDAELEAMVAASALDRQKNPPPTLSGVHFDASTRQIVLSLPNGGELRVTLSSIAEIANATDAELATLRVLHGETIELEALDVHISVEGLLSDLVLGEGWRRRMAAGFAAEAARHAGIVRSAAKAAAARANGAKGGRPRKARAVAESSPTQVIREKPPT